MNDFGYYALALVVLVVGLFVLKKVATCMIKAMVAVVMVAVLASSLLALLLKVELCNDGGIQVFRYFWLVNWLRLSGCKLWMAATFYSNTLVSG